VVVGCRGRELDGPGSRWEAPDDRHRPSVRCPGPGRAGRADQHLPGSPLQAGRQAPRKKLALVAVGNSILTICWHLLSDPGAHFADLGPDWHDRLAPQRRKRQLIAELERLSGKKITLNDAA